MKGPLNWIVTKLEFTKDQAKGTLYLALITFLVIVGFGLFDQYYEPELKFAVTSDSSVVFVEDTIENVVPSALLQDTISEGEEILTPSVIEEIKQSPIYLNSCNENDLKQIKGIGDKLSARIIKYRNMLGGYVSSNQLYEVYYIDSAVIDRELNSFVIDTSQVTRINVATCTFKELLRHPYYEYETVKSVFQLKDKGRLTKPSVDSLFQTKKGMNPHALYYLSF